MTFGMESGIMFLSKLSFSLVKEWGSPYHIHILKVKKLISLLDKRFLSNYWKIFSFSILLVLQASFNLTRGGLLALMLLCESSEKCPQSYDVSSFIDIAVWNSLEVSW